MGYHVEQCEVSQPLTYVNEKLKTTLARSSDKF